MNRVLSFALLMPCLLLVGCAGGAGYGGSENDTADSLANDPRLGEPVDTVCFAGGISGFREIGDMALVIRDAPQSSYLVRTGHCPNMKAIEGLKLEGGDQCLSRGEGLLVFDTQFPRQASLADQPDRCLVLSIHEWWEQN